MIGAQPYALPQKRIGILRAEQIHESIGAMREDKPVDVEVVLNGRL